ncbi:LAMI_0H08372g1_1 [Lachancea mirantina]|uniref:LAMI_0H08372g1_1 n=1 Tax=Lachancea mirantina TaxID=1230905 RepID=A0A1G4KG17_9SACH|nr:LAMI_0H08372g1_1 [Lachancea mirantina]
MGDLDARGTSAHPELSERPSIMPSMSDIQDPSGDDKATPRGSAAGLPQLELPQLELAGHARRLGHLENFFAVQHRQQIYSSFAVFCEFDTACSLAQLASAVRNVCLSNPLLLHTVEPKHPDIAGFYHSDEYLSRPWPQHDYMRVLREVHVADVVMNGQKEHAHVVRDAVDVFQAHGNQVTSELLELMTQIEIPHASQTRPSWRLLCFPHGEANRWRTFAFVSNHCSSDGLSGLNFFRDLQKELAHGPTSGAPGAPGAPGASGVIFDYAQDAATLPKLPPPIDQKLDYRPSKKALLGLLAGKFVREKLGYVSAAPPTTPTSDLAHPEGHQYYCYLVNVPTSSVAHIKTQVRENVPHKCTLTPFLQACWLVSLFKYGRVFSGSWLERYTDVLVAMNTRQLLPEDLELQRQYRYGSNVGGVRYNYPIAPLDVRDNDQKFWSLVESYRLALSDARDKNDYLYALGALMLPEIYEKKNVDAVVNDTILNQRRSGTLISNVGYVRDEQPTAFAIKNHVFSQGVGANRNAFVLNICATDQGGLNIAISIAKGTLASRQEGQELCDIFKSTLLRF